MPLVIVPILLLPEALPLWVVCTALGLVPIYFILHLLVRRDTVTTPFSIPILLLLLSVPLSLYASVDMRVSLPKLAGILLGLCLFYTLTPARSVPWGPPLAVAISLLGGLAISLVALIATDWLSAKLPLLGNLVRYLPKLIASIPHPLKQGGGINPNEVGGALALILPLNLVLAWRALSDSNMLRNLGGLKIPRSWVSGFLAISLLITLFTLALSQSRSAFFGVTIGVILLAAIRYRFVRFSVLVLLLVTAAALYGIGVEQMSHRLLDAGASVTQPAAGVSTLDFASRVEVWQRAVYMIQDFPFTGIGLNTFPIVVGALYPFFLISPDTYVAHAHNILLQVGVDFGIPGMVAYASLVTVFFGCAIIAFRQAENPTRRAVIAGLAAGMVAHQVYGLTDAITLGAKPGFLFWIILALIAILYARPVTVKVESGVTAPPTSAILARE